MLYSHSAESDEELGPKFRTEPPFRVEFSNSSGAEIRCSADGKPSPRISWQTREGAVARDIPGLRYTRSDGTMVFPPFSRDDYRQDVHDTLYQCLAENPLGAIVSKETHIRGGKFLCYVIFAIKIRHGEFGLCGKKIVFQRISGMELFNRCLFAI